MRHNAGQYLTYAEVFRPSSRYYSLFYEITVVTGFSFIIALSAAIAIPLPFSPVPITLQTLAVLLAGMLLGSKRGLLCVLTYIGEGAAGMPVFAGGASGLAYMAGPTGGYLIGFLFAVYMTGLFSENGWDRKILTATIAMLLGNTIIYSFGLLWLGFYVAGNEVLSLGLYPFIPGEVSKLIAAVLILPTGWKLIKSV